MKFPTYKDTSLMLDEYQLKLQKPKMSKTKKLFIHVGILMALCFIESAANEVAKKQAFNKKYKTVIKENFLGIKSYEYHERS